MRVTQEGKLPVLIVPGVEVLVEERRPAPGRPVQQGRDAAGRGQGDGATDSPACGVDVALVVAALQGVLKLQLELPTAGQRAEVEPVIALGLADHDELVDAGAARELPAGLVADAERRVPLPPQGAERQQADRAPLIGDGGQGSQPGRAARLPGAFPETVVTDAKTPPGTTEAASGDHAFGQLFAAEKIGAGRGREDLHVRASVLFPPVVVAPAKLAGPWHPQAPRHPAGPGVENQRPWLGDQDVDPELWPDHGHQPGQQPAAIGRRARSGTAGYHRTSRPVRKPAASRARRASSAVRWPYTSIVVAIEECPSKAETTSIDAPPRNSLVA